MSDEIFSGLFTSTLDEMDQHQSSQESFQEYAAMDFPDNKFSDGSTELTKGTLYWSNQSNNNHQRLMQSFKRLLNKNKRLGEYYKSLSKDEEIQLERFLANFFPENIPFSYFVANLSLQDNSDKRINLAIRLHNHGNFVDLLPTNRTISIRGYWPVMQRAPVFIPEDIFTTHNDENAASYEIELLAFASSLPPERNSHNNVLTKNLAQELPPISVETAARLKEWLEFLKFKRELVKEKTVGLRYLRFGLNNEDQLEFLVVGECRDEIERANHAFRRKDLEAFELGISMDEWQFTISDKNLSRRIPRGFELGQLKGKVTFIDKNETKRYTDLLVDLYEKGLDKPVLASVKIELPEDWKNKLSNAEHDDIRDGEELSNDDYLPQYREIKKELLSNVPEQGFISFPSVGDLALIKRHEQTIKNLRQNEGCYSPYLSSYLFDIDKANKLEQLPEVEDWFNKDLNDAQKNAVEKMLGAPDLCLVQGPPGTGKTTVIAEAILQLAKQGETILLASQSHDAIDNALSCIRNHPELRAIRLARGQGKITDEGKVFSEHRALERYYNSLHNHVQASWIKPQQDKEKEIETLNSWAEKANFIASDLVRTKRAHSEILIETKACRKRFKKAKQLLEEAHTRYDNLQHQKQATEQNIISLKEGKGSMLPAAYFSHSVYSLIECLSELSEIKVKLPEFHDSYLTTDNSESLALILTKLLPIWRDISSRTDSMKHDLLRLQTAGEGGLQDEGTQVQLANLIVEIEHLANLMDEDDSFELQNKWRAARKQKKEIEHRQSGLDEKNYFWFADKEIFANVIDASETALLLFERLNKLERISDSVRLATHIVIEEQQSWLLENREAEAPGDDEVKTAESELSYSERELSQAQSKLQKTENQAREHLREQDLIESGEFEMQLAMVKEHTENLSVELMEESKIRAPWEGFFTDWAENLSEQNTAQSDWEHIEKTFVENCNLVAISCNESDQTLKNAGVESFDTVIIDEVSKATPVELLLPLMRGRRAILVGDHRQLPPVFQESQDAQAFTDKAEEAQEEGDSQILTKDNLRRFEKMVTASLFKEHFENADPSIRERLIVQYRMHPQIMKIVNNFYEGQLECGNPEKSREHGLHIKGKNNVLLSKKDHVLWIDTSRDLKDKTYTESEERTNQLEARLIANTLVKINEQSRNSGFNQKNKQKVGVVSFYASQCRVIREEISKVNGGKIQFDAIHVEINTVIRYQGKEKPILLISLVRNDGGPKNKRRSARANVARYEFINVAMSRAQNLLVVFGARNMLEQRDVFLPNMDTSGKKKVQVYRKIFSDLDRAARIFPASEMLVQEVKKSSNAKKRGRR